MTTQTIFTRLSLSTALPESRQAPTHPDLLGLLRRFKPISLAEMDPVALLKRRETEFVMTISQLVDTLPALVERYRALDINDLRLGAYQTLYFDTPDFTSTGITTTSAGADTKCAAAITSIPTV